MPPAELVVRRVRVVGLGGARSSGCWRCRSNCRR